MYETKTTILYTYTHFRYRREERWLTPRVFSSLCFFCNERTTKAVEKGWAVTAIPETKGGARIF